MSDLKNQLIRLGKTNPKLRPHLRKVIQALSKVASGVITDREEPPRGWRGYHVSQTYEIVTQESASRGEADDRGFDFQNEKYISLEEAIDDHARSHTWLIGDSDVDFEFRIRSESRQDYRTGDYTSHTLFIKRADGKPLSREEADYIYDHFG